MITGKYCPSRAAITIRYSSSRTASQSTEGYATDITTDKAIAWLDNRKGADKQETVFLMCQHKAPHRTFAPPLRHLETFDGVEIPEPETLFDDYKNRSATLAGNEMEIDRHFDLAYDAKVRKDENAAMKLPKPDRYGTPGIC